MKTMVLDRPGEPLREAERPERPPGPGQVALRVSACGVCRTDLHVVDGELPDLGRPVVPGHQIVGVVEAVGQGVARLAVGQRVGVPWLGWTCGACRFCVSGRENLCPQARFTGYHLDGGFAEWTVADARYGFPIPEGYPDLQAAPLLCAGLIGYRSLSMVGDASRLGLFGFGAAAHIVAQVARYQGRDVYAFTRPGDAPAQRFALELGARWAGELVPRALRAVDRGGTVVCAGIHMSDIPSFPYRILWEERVVRSVANLTRKDAEEFLALAPRVPVRTEVEVFGLARANEALDRLRAGRIRGAAVLEV
jgi:propanol-preferring alcohol dehydrogenase